MDGPTPNRTWVALIRLGQLSKGKKRHETKEEGAGGMRNKPKGVSGSAYGHIALNIHG